MEKIVVAMYCILALLIVLILRMIRIERQVRLKIDLKTCQQLFTMQESNSKNDLSNAISEVSNTLETGLVSMGGIFAYESFRNKVLISDLLIVQVSTYGQLKFLDCAIETLEETCSMLNDFKADLEGENKLLADVTEGPSLKEVNQMLEKYHNKLVDYYFARDELESAKSKYTEEKD